MVEEEAKMATWSLGSWNPQVTQPLPHDVRGPHTQVHLTHLSIRLGTGGDEHAARVLGTKANRAQRRPVSFKKLLGVQREPHDWGQCRADRWAGGRLWVRGRRRGRVCVCVYVFTSHQSSGDTGSTKNQVDFLMSVWLWSPPLESCRVMGDLSGLLRPHQITVCPGRHCETRGNLEGAGKWVR